MIAVAAAATTTTTTTTATTTTTTTTTTTSSTTTTTSTATTDCYCCYHDHQDDHWMTTMTTTSTTTPVTAAAKRRTLRPDLLRPLRGLYYVSEHRRRCATDAGYTVGTLSALLSDRGKAAQRVRSPRLTCLVHGRHSDGLWKVLKAPLAGTPR